MTRGIYKRKEGIYPKIPRTIAHKRNTSETMKSKGIKPVHSMKGSENPKWKGNSVGYRSLHSWIIRNKPKSMFCEICGKITEKLDASSIEHTYERDISKWRWICRRCHKREDGKLVQK